MVITVASVLAALIGAGITFVGARYFWAPQPNAAGFGIPGVPTGNLQAWLLVKGVRDIASGLFVAVLLAYGNHHLLGWFMLAATFIPVGDALIVLRSNGSRAAAYGIHGATAAVMLAISALLLLG